jgi:hypothetical protein
MLEQYQDNITLARAQSREQCSQWLEGSMEWSSVTPWSRSGVEERSRSNGMEWSGVVDGHSIELHGVPKKDVAEPNQA